SEDALVVLVDLLMPRLDGMGVLHAVAEDEELASRHTYVLVTVSRQVTPQDLPAKLASSVRILPKPFDESPHRLRPPGHAPCHHAPAPTAAQGLVSRKSLQRQRCGSGRSAQPACKAWDGAALSVHKKVLIHQRGRSRMGAQATRLLE